MENTGVEIALSRLEDVIEEHERVIVAGAPRIYRYETLRELAEKRRVVFAEKPKELLREKTEGREVVIADFYGFFKDYRSLSEKKREEVREKLSRASKACISLRLYELLWLMYEHPGELEKLCGELKEWKGVLLSVSEEEAKEVLTKRAGDCGVKDEVEKFVERAMKLLKKKKYEVSFKRIDELIEAVIREKESRKKLSDTLRKIFGDEIEKEGKRLGFWKYKYVSWLPGLVLIKDVGRIESIERFFELLAGEGFLKRLVRVGKEFTADLSLGTVIKSVHSGIEGTLEMLREGEWGDIVQGLLRERWQLKAALASAAPYAGLNLALMGTLMSIWWLMKREENKLKEFLKKVQELPEEHLLLLEEEFGLKPRSLIYLKQVMEGDVERLLKDLEEIEEKYRLLDRAVQELGERVDNLEERLKRLAEELWETVDELRILVLVAAEREYVYRWLKDFEDEFTRTFGELGEYIPPGFEEPERDDWSYGLEMHAWASAEREGADALSRVEELLSNGADVVCIYGDGGIGKSRLILELGKRLSLRKDVFYIKRGRKVRFRERLFERDTVVFVDDALAGEGRIDYAGLAEKTRRQDRRYRVQVVLTEKKQFRDELRERLDKDLELTGIEKAELTLKPLSREDVVRLLERKVPREVAEKIYKYTAGNPYFSLLVAEHVRGGRKLGKRSIKEALESEVKYRYLQWVEEDRDEAMELLKAAAVLGGIDDETLKRMGGANTVLKKLGRSEILRLLEVDGDWEYRLSVDIIGDYLRSMVVVEEPFPDSCDALLKYFEYAPERVGEVVRGLVALHGNSLMERVFPGLRGRVLTCIRSVLEESMERVELEEVLRACVPATYAVPDALTQELRSRLIEKIGQRREKKLAQPLFEIATAFFLSGRMEEGEEFLTELRKLQEKHAEKEVRVELAKALTNAVAGWVEVRKPEKAGQYLEELRKLHKEHGEKEVRIELAKALTNAVWGWDRAGRPEKAEQYLEELRKLHKEHGEKEVRIELAKALYNKVLIWTVSIWTWVRGKLKGAAERLRAWAMKGEPKGYLEELRELHKRYEEKEVRRELARALHYAVWGWGMKHKPEEAEKYLEELRELHKRYEEKEVRRELARALYYEFWAWTKKGRPKEAEKYLDELRKLYKRHEEKEVGIPLAEALFCAVWGWSKKGLPDNATKHLDELRKIYEMHEEKEVRKPLARALFAVIWELSVKRDGLNTAEKYLNELRRLYERYEEEEHIFGRPLSKLLGFKEVREWFAKALVSVVLGWAESGNLEKAEEYVDELRKLHERYEEKEVREALAEALAYAVWGWSEKGLPDAAEKYLDELRKLYKRHEEKEVGILLADALFSIVWDWVEKCDLEKAEKLARELEQVIARLHPVTRNIAQDIEELRADLHVLLMEVLKEHGERHELVVALLRATLNLCRSNTGRHQLCREVRRKLRKLLETGMISTEAYSRITEPCGVVSEAGAR